MATNDQSWYGVRTLVRFLGSPQSYEERVTLWRADSFDEAIRRGEDEGREYATDLNGELCDLVQAFRVGPDPIGEGSEVFSLVRDNELSPGEYVDAFFDTGGEYQRHT